MGENIVNTLYSSPFFAISITLITFSIGRFISRKVKISIANEVLISSILSILIIISFDIPIDEYVKGGSALGFMIIPATIALAFSVYGQLLYVKKYIIPILVGSIVGSAVSIGSIIFLTSLFDVPSIITFSLIPKSVTSAIAIELSKLLKGEPSIAILSVMLTGFTGVIAGPLLIKAMRITDPIVIGLSFGISSHVIGTSKAFDYGEVEGALSGVAIFFTGIITVILSLILF